MDTFQVSRTSDRKKTPDLVTVRHMTGAEIMALTYNDHPSVILNSGRLGQVKINGQIRAWKRDPARVEIPVKYGMYEHATFSLSEAMERFVVEVTE